MKQNLVIMLICLSTLLGTSLIIPWMYSPANPPEDDEPINVWRPFSNDSIWNTKIPQNVDLHSNSVQMIEWLENRPYTLFGINIHTWSVPVYNADDNTPKVTVYCIGENSPIDGTYEGPYHYTVPFPVGAYPDSQLDSSMIVLDWTTKTEWDFFGLEQRSTGKWHARACIPWGPAVEPKPNSGYLPNFIDGNGVMPKSVAQYTWGARGSSVPLLAGLIRPEEIEAGVIPHALVFSCSCPKQGVKVYPPASTTDGKNTDQYAIPEGARLQLDPNLDLDEIPNLSENGKIIARCMQEYGIILVDCADGLPLYAENPKGRNIDPWVALGFTGYDARPIPLSCFRVVDYAVFDAVLESFP